MADIGSITIRWFVQNDLYQYEIDNRPLEDLYSMIQLVNTESTANASEIVTARGSLSTLDARLDVSLNDDGTIKGSGIPTGIAISKFDDDTPVPATDPNYANKRVVMTLAERDRLQNVEANANRNTFRIGNETGFSGNIKLVAGKTVRLTHQKSPTGDEIVFIDTIFPHDRLHQHRYHQIITDYSDGVARFPNEEDNAIPGSVKVFHNGLQLRRSAFSEYTDPQTGKINGFTVLEDASEINPIISDDLWCEYEIRPTWDSLVSDPLFSGVGLPAHYPHTLSLSPGDDWATVDLDGTNFNFWMVDISSLNLVEPYERFALYVSEVAWPPTSNDVQGRTYRRYGHEWDVVKIGATTYLRWRYDVAGSGVDGIPTDAETIAWLQEEGSGSTDNPNTNYAPANLSGGEHIDLIYFEPVV